MLIEDIQDQEREIEFGERVQSTLNVMSDWLLLCDLEESAICQYRECHMPARALAAHLFDVIAAEIAAAKVTLRAQVEKNIAAMMEEERHAKD